VRRPVLTLLFLSFLTFFFGLGRQAIGDADEGFYAEAVREMVEGGDWLTPHFNYEYRWQKPILYYWLTAATYLLTGPTEWAARLWSALSGAGLVLLTWGASRRLLLDHRSAWLAGAIAATCYGYFAMARAALPDLPLAFCITLCIWAALERRWALCGLGAGLGFLLKGPVAVVVPGVVLVPIWWRERKSLVIRPRDLAIAAAVFAVVGAPWYAAVTVTHGAAYLQSFFIGDNLERFATDRFNEPRPFWFYAPIVIGGMMPWAAYLLILPRRLPGQLLRRTRELTTAEWRLLTWAVMPLLFFTVSIGKQPRYILPVLPPFAILLARAIVTRIELVNTQSRGDARVAHTSAIDLVVATWTTAVMYAGLAVLLFRARSLFITAYPSMTLIATAAILIAAAALSWVAASRAWKMLPVTMAAAATVLLLAAQFGALSGMRPEPVEEMAGLVQTNRTADEPVGEYQAFVRNLIFYTRFRQVELFNEAGALDFMKSPNRVLLVIRPGDLERLETISGVSMRRLGEVKYLNTANIKLRTLFWPIPSQDLQTALLVTNR
jgi:4-amino-4-deoxy-L-arabinose transferase-like glycosyltransferase